MKDYVKPYVVLIFYKTQSILTTSGDAEEIGNDGNASFDIYNYDETWL